MYSLTPRSFFNAVAGQRKKEDITSRENWLMTRKIMFAAMKPYLKEGVEETDILPLPWEENLVKELSETRTAEILEEIEKGKAFWDDFDNKKQQKTELD